MPSPFTQLSVQNVTPADRRFFVLSARLPVSEVGSIIFGAWESFLLSTGEIGYFAYSSAFQLAARSLDPMEKHQRLLQETTLGAAWEFQVKEGFPILGPKSGPKPPAGQISCSNTSSGEVAVTLFNNFQELIAEVPVPSQQTVSFQPLNKLFFYASVPVTDPQQPFVFEPEVAEATASGSEVVVQLLQEGSKLSWKVS